MDVELLRDLVKRHEGFRGQPYLDTAGHTTIGYGRNLDANPITPEEAEVLLENDLNRAWDACVGHVPRFSELDAVRQAVLVSMAFNLGISGLMQFRRMLLAVQRGRFDRAAAEMLDSQWARQVHARATELAAMMRSGRWNDSKEK
jgi:lysozyme